MNTETLEVLSANLFSIQICCHKNLANKEVALETNLARLAGTVDGWTIPSEETYQEIVGDLSPDIANGQVVCDNNPDKRHWLLTC